MPDLWDVLLLALAAFGAGMLNSAAGGGSFLTLPALVFVGLPPAMANATGTLALLPGYFSGAWAFRRDLVILPRSRLLNVCILGMVGGIAGAALLLITPAEVFRGIVPWLLLVATIIFMLGPLLVKKRDATPAADQRQSLGLLAVSIYGGYFNGGIGIMLLALFGLAGSYTLNTMNGLKNLASGVLTIVAVVIYIAGGLIAWRETGIMMIFATLGGYIGGRLASRISTTILRILVVSVGLIMTGLMFVFG